MFDIWICPLSWAFCVSEQAEHLSSSGAVPDRGSQTRGLASQCSLESLCLQALCSPHTNSQPPGGFLRLWPLAWANLPISSERSVFLGRAGWGMGCFMNDIWHSSSLYKAFHAFDFHSSMERLAEFLINILLLQMRLCVFSRMESRQILSPYPDHPICEWHQDWNLNKVQSTSQDTKLLACGGIWSQEGDLLFQEQPVSHPQRFLVWRERSGSCLGGITVPWHSVTTQFMGHAQ